MFPQRGRTKGLVENRLLYDTRILRKAPYCNEISKRRLFDTVATKSLFLCFVTSCSFGEMECAMASIRAALGQDVWSVGHYVSQRCFLGSVRREIRSACASTHRQLAPENHWARISCGYGRGFVPPCPNRFVPEGSVRGRGLEPGRRPRPSASQRGGRGGVLRGRIG